MPSKIGRPAHSKQKARRKFPRTGLSRTKQKTSHYVVNERSVIVLFSSVAYTSCFRIVIKRKTVLKIKMFMPAIRHPIETINGKFSDLKSLTLKAINKTPMLIAVQAIHLSVSAAFLSLFMTQDPCRLRFSFFAYTNYCNTKFTCCSCFVQTFIEKLSNIFVQAY